MRPFPQTALLPRGVFATTVSCAHAARSESEAGFSEAPGFRVKKTGHKVLLAPEVGLFTIDADYPAAQARVKKAMAFVHAKFAASAGVIRRVLNP